MIKCVYTSVWDDAVEINSHAEVNEKTGIVEILSDFENNPSADDIDVCTKQYITIYGEEFDVDWNPDGELQVISNFGMLNALIKEKNKKPIKTFFESNPYLQCNAVGYPKKFTCTRIKDHKGQHIACTLYSQEFLQKWPNKKIKAEVKKVDEICGKPGPEGWTCSLSKGHTGSHYAHHSHDLNAECLEIWSDPKKVVVKTNKCKAFEEDADKRCMNKNYKTGEYCTRTKFHEGIHIVHTYLSGLYIDHWEQGPEICAAKDKWKEPCLQPKDHEAPHLSSNMSWPKHSKFNEIICPSYDSWHCSLPKGHTGNHVGLSFEDYLDEWPQGEGKSL